MTEFKDYDFIKQSLIYVCATVGIIFIGWFIFHRLFLFFKFSTLIVDESSDLSRFLMGFLFCLTAYIAQKWEELHSFNIA